MEAWVEPAPPAPVLAEVVPPPAPADAEEVVVADLAAPVLPATWQEVVACFPPPPRPYELFSREMPFNLDVTDQLVQEID